jgi:ABC-2 type transport system ATP-binding protein
VRVRRRPLTRRAFWSHINAMVERRVTVMVTTYFVVEAEYCERVALVSRGQVVAEGSLDALNDQVKSVAHPELTLANAFVELVEAFDRRE